MKSTHAFLPGVVLLEPAVHRDERGWFMESYVLERMKAKGVDVTFVQDNHLQPAPGHAEGLHFQNEPMARKLGALHRDRYWTWS
jgi:dTDP-4-dehydrorhamnose 3,5-epimerase